MNLIGYINDLLHPRPKAKMRPSQRRPETTREAAARAIERMISERAKR